VVVIDLQANAVLKDKFKEGLLSFCPKKTFLMSKLLRHGSYQSLEQHACASRHFKGKMQGKKFENYLV
jgi:hypothetical protein